VETLEAAAAGVLDMDPIAVALETSAVVFRSDASILRPTWSSFHADGPAGSVFQEDGERRSFQPVERGKCCSLRSDRFKHPWLLPQVNAIMSNRGRTPPLTAGIDTIGITALMEVATLSQSDAEETADDICYLLHQQTD
jgi:hypothetical protein